MFRCPFCVWRELDKDARQALIRLPARLLPPIRNQLLGARLVEFHQHHSTGTLWRTTSFGEAVIRAGQVFMEQENNGT